MATRKHFMEGLQVLTGTTCRRVLAYSLLAGLWIALSDTAIIALAGADGALGIFLTLKGILFALLTAAALFLFFRRNSTQQAMMQKELFLAQHDPSTNLFRRAEWIRRVDRLLSDKQTLREPATVLTVMVNRYDYLVHRYGFENLNQLLAVFGRRLRVLVRAGDLVGSVSPAVFVIYMHGMGSHKQAMEIVERILETGKRTFLMEDEPVTLNLNIGLCSYPDNGTNAEDLLARANIAMERAESEGSNRSSWYMAEMAEKVITRVSLEKDLEKALDRQELMLHFQPRVLLPGGEGICSYEALLRWQHPRRGLIPPAAFIDVAEDTGLIVDIGRWVLAESVVFLRRLARAGLPSMNVSVNVSNAQLTKGDFIKDIEGVLGRSHEYARQIELEITESLAMSDPQLTMQVLKRVKEIGMHVSLDDFGTGYSSLSYLHRFPIDCLKIDRSFIVDLVENRHNQELTKTVIGLGHALGARVLAEGVETLAQVRMLTEFGCDEAQGYYFGHPMPATQAISAALEPSSSVIYMQKPAKPVISALESGLTAERGAAHAQP
ncbi:MAG: putative bifunctional diguanylate cyclase/phosphodiesterase [Gammaproteobacteria bacterium]